eukprot:5495331-Alexandrium_andersonii.AAC.1
MADCGLGRIAALAGPRRAEPAFQRRTSKTASGCFFQPKQMHNAVLSTARRLSAPLGAARR